MEVEHVDKHLEEPHDEEIVQSKSETTEESVDHVKGQANYYNLVTNRQRRVIRPPDLYGHDDMIYFTLTTNCDLDNSEPISYKEMLKSKDKLTWIKAMDEEIKSLYKNKTWKLVQRPKNQKVMGCICKQGILGIQKDRWKSRFVAKQFTQVLGADFNEIFSTVLKHTCIRIILQ